MKVNYTFEKQRKIAWRPKLRCPYCGSWHYLLVQQLEPHTAFQWHVECPMCEYEGLDAFTQEGAICQWKYEHGSKYGLKDYQEDIWSIY